MTAVSSTETRLAALEAKLGLLSSSDVGSTADISARLNDVQSTMDRQATPQFKAAWSESQALLRQLDPGTGLTHQQQPLLYKRQEVLAASATLERDMGELGKILHLLLNSQARKDVPNQELATPGKKGSTAPSTVSTTTLREDQVTQAPILTSTKVSPEDERRLDAVRLSMEEINGRTKQLMAKMDHMLECYHSVVAAASEKCILADEVLASKGK